MLKYTSNIVVCLNKYDTDDLEEINIIEKFVKSKNVEFAISSAYSNGGNGAIELAEKVVNICNQENDFKQMRCARHKRPIDRRYGADLRFSLAGRALGESAQRLPFGKIRRQGGRLRWFCS